MNDSYTGPKVHITYAAHNKGDEPCQSRPSLEEILDNFGHDYGFTDQTDDLAVKDHVEIKQIEIDGQVVWPKKEDNPHPLLDTQFDPDIHRFEVQVTGCTYEQAEQVLRERLGHDEDYGFNYRLNW